MRRDLLHLEYKNIEGKNSVLKLLFEKIHKKRRKD